jgi:hypothetical protein
LYFIEYLHKGGVKMKIGYYELMTGNLGYYDGVVLEDVDARETYEDYEAEFMAEKYLGEDI